MKIDILTLFPEMFSALNSSIIGKAVEKGLLTINVVDIREYSTDPHKKCDDYPFGGGAGMVMTPQPIYDCIQAVDPEHKAKRIYMSPKGKILKTSLVSEMAKTCDSLVILCGHYEGVDQRVIDLCIDEEISIGDYVLTGGELAAMVLTDAVARYVPNVLHSAESTDEESFSQGLLEYPQYTRPREFKGLTVPDVLLGGNHADIVDWRNDEAIKITLKNRPDMLED
jgi:tRNA (guanine37-N1)-methyltransferase